MATKEKDKFHESEGYLRSLIIDNEYMIAKSNNQQQYNDFESILDMLELVRSEKNYDWMSDVFIGLMFSHSQTEAANWAMQDFATRDFCEIYLEGTSEEDVLKAEAAKRIINVFLNDRGIFHFHKRIRARLINWMFGQVYALMWWEKEVETKKIPQPDKTQLTDDFDENGQPYQRQISIPQEPVEVSIPVIDRPNYEVFDARNVFTDFSYSYSVQDKPWVIFRAEKRWSEIKSMAAEMRYFNLDKVEIQLWGQDKKKKESIGISESETSQETFNKIGGAYGTKQTFFKQPDPAVDVLTRYGKIWAVVTERDEDNIVVKIEPGYDDMGAIKKNAEFVEAIITYIGYQGNYILIGFQPTWAIDAKGRTYKPILRAWCYIHPTKDIGLSDGKNVRETNIAVNDMYNLAADRTLISTMPTMVGRREAIVNNPTIFIAPEHTILVEDPATDLREMRISDNIGGSLQMISLLQKFLSEMDAIYPPSMGSYPERAETATAIVGAESKTGARSNFRNLTWTNTFDLEFYHMILHMTYRFAEPETVRRILGPELYQYFDANEEYTFVPLTGNIEKEHEKAKKIQALDQMIGRIAGLLKIAPQKYAPLIDMIVEEICKTYSGDFRRFAEYLKKSRQAQVPAGGEKGAEQTEDMKGAPVSNQMGIEMSSQEMAGRGI